MEPEHYQPANPIPTQNSLDADFEGLKRIQHAIHQTAVTHGFWDDLDRLKRLVNKHGTDFGVDRELPDLLLKMTRSMLTVTELSEAVEFARNKDASDDKLPQYSGFTVELADAIIRIFDMAARWELPVIDAVRDKMNFNKSRPYKHGKSI